MASIPHHGTAPIHHPGTRRRTPDLITRVESPAKIASGKHERAGDDCEIIKRTAEDAGHMARAGEQYPPAPRTLGLSSFDFCLSTTD